MANVRIAIIIIKKKSGRAGRHVRCPLAGETEAQREARCSGRRRHARAGTSHTASHRSSAGWPFGWGAIAPISRKTKAQRDAHAESAWRSLRVCRLRPTPAGCCTSRRLLGGPAWERVRHGQGHVGPCREACGHRAGFRMRRTLARPRLCDLGTHARPTTHSLTHRMGDGAVPPPLPSAAATLC